MIGRGDVVLFLGAGFSRSAGLPVMKDFGKDSDLERETLTKRHGTLDQAERGFRHAVGQLLDAAATFEAFRDLCRRSHTRSAEDWENLETLFGVAEVLSESDGREILLGEQAFSPESILRDLQLWIWKIYQRLPLVDTDQRTVSPSLDPKAYELFFKLLDDTGVSSRSTVLTTNYDLVFEHLAKKYSGGCIYPMQSARSITVSRHPTSYLGRADDIVGIPVCKLHGSVNYFENASAPDSLDLLIADDLGGNLPVGKSGSFAGRAALLAVDAIWVLQKKYGAGITPAIIPPSYAKLSRRDWLRQTWRVAREALTTARTIVFIGYSLPQSDGFMAALLAAAESDRRSGAGADVIVVDPSKGAFERIAEVYGEPRVKWIGEDLATAVRQSLPDLLATVV